MTNKEKFIWTIRWMNLSRFKNKNGSLNIKETTEYKTEQEALDAYERFTKTGYALQLNKIPVVRYEGYGGKFVWHRKDPEVVKENLRWKFRMRAYKIHKLRSQILELEHTLQSKRIELSILEQQE